MNSLTHQQDKPDKIRIRALELKNSSNVLIKKGIWIYFLLLLFEGALRKWFLPSLAGPLLVIRDPLCIWILIQAWRNGSLNLNQYSISMGLIGIFGLYTALFLGHGNFYVALYGSRQFLLHFPLIFVMAKVLDKEDVLKFARATLVISILMILLIMTQFYSPQSAWVNKTVGGDAGGGFSGAMNFYRPSGTFSFTNGNTLFFNFAACFITYFWFKFKEVNRLLLLLSTIALVLSIPFSISRSLFFQVLITVIFTVIATFLKPKHAFGMIIVVSGLFGFVILLSFTTYFTTATLAFTSRFDIANSQEGGLNGVFFDRFLGGMIQAISLSSHQPFFGYGIGLGTNVGTMLTVGGRGFLIAEGEWGRMVGEIGPVLGLTIVFLRLKLAISILFQSFKTLSSGNFLPWILISYAFLLIAQGGWAQPTSLGFCTLLGGLTLASFNEKSCARLKAIPTNNHRSTYSHSYEHHPVFTR
jgi:hypothetical protein